MCVCVCVCVCPCPGWGDKRMVRATRGLGEEGGLSLDGVGLRRGWVFGNLGVVQRPGPLEDAGVGRAGELSWGRLAGGRSGLCAESQFP